MGDSTYYDDNADARSSFDVQLPIQLHSRPASRMSTDLLQDLGGGNTPEKIDMDSDQYLVKHARNLGLRIPEIPRDQVETINLIKSNVSAVTITSSQLDASVTQSRTSNSTRPTSYSSSDRQAEQKITAPIIPLSSVAASVTSTSQSVQSPVTRERPDSKFRKSLRRLSTLGRKRMSGTNELLRPSLPRIESSAPGPRRPVTAEARSPPSLPPVLPPLSISRRSVGGSLPSFSEARVTTLGRVTANTLRPLTPPSEEKEVDLLDSPFVLAAKQRSLHCGRLQRLRIAHLDEQASFIAARRSELNAIRSRHHPARQRVHDNSQEKRAAALSRHSVVNSDLETRHLSAEMDLDRALSAERKSCETKIKYMEAYCYGSRNRNLNAAPLSPTESAKAVDAAAAGMPARKVTDSDYRKLVEQYHLRNGMAQLHAARINVLREQQAKQAERIINRQERELERFEEERDRELALIEAEIKKEISSVQKEWETRKQKMIWRWNVKESIERKTLEAERGEVYGELPEVVWGSEEDAWDKDTGMESKWDNHHTRGLKERDPDWDMEVRSLGAIEGQLMSLNFATRGPLSVAG